MKNQRAKVLYIDGNNITSIATALNLTRTTIYTYKKEDLKNNIDWDELRYLKQTSSIAKDGDEKRFLATLIQSFENAMAGLEEIEDAEKRLNILTRFVGAYHKIKNPTHSDTKGATAKGASQAIYAVSQLAVEQGNTAVVNFLSEYHNIVIERVISSIKT